MTDHVHLLVEVDPEFGVTKLIRYMKGRSKSIPPTGISLAKITTANTLDK